MVLAVGVVVGVVAFARVCAVGLRFGTCALGGVGLGAHGIAGVDVILVFIR